MDLHSIDPRATSPAASGRNSQSSSGGAFQGVMQMMAEIATQRTESRAQSETYPADRTDRTRDADDRDDVRESETTDADKDETEGTEAATVVVQPAVAEVPPSPAGPEIADVTVDLETAPAAPKPTETVDNAATAPATAEPSGEAAAADTVPAQAAPTRSPVADSPAPQTSAARTPEARTTPVQPAARPAAETAAPAARQVTVQAEQMDAASRAIGSGNKSEGTAGRTDALMGAKVTVETPTPVARSQGVSSAVLVQAQQAAAGHQPQVSTANGGAGTLHVGGNQPTFVGADGNTANSANGQNSGNQAAGGQNSGGQNAGAQNQGQNSGQGGQANPQQVGVSFGATIGQRGFGGEASRAQFQQILATRTARAQPGSLSAGDGVRPMGAATGSTSTPSMTVAGVGGPQSTHTSASSVNRAAATAHGRPGASVGTPADQVAVKLSATAKDGGGKVTMRLNPEELGKVDIRMEISKEGHVRAVISVDRPETLELLQKDAKGLERTLQDAGLQADGDSLEFNLRGDGGHHAGDADDNADGKGMAEGGAPDLTDEGDALANDQQGDDGAGGMKADGSLDLVA